MHAESVSREEYESAAKNIVNVFNTPAFNELNRAKVDDILYILVKKENSPRFGVIFGKTEDRLKCPFSAPFGYIEMLKKDQSVSEYYEALHEIEKLIGSTGISQASFTLPPDFYDNYTISVWYNALFMAGWKVDNIDLSFSMNIDELIDDYKTKIHYNARRNLNIAERSDLTIKEAVTHEDKLEAYDIIRRNRAWKGFPLRMTCEQVMNTIEVVPAHMYIVYSEGEGIASALIYDVKQDIAQVIYWGDVEGHSEKKVINFLAYKLLNIYKERGFSYLDIGPSTENGEPNFGLCDFKDSIGCMRSAKVRFTKSFR